jgi:hypothetical protein
MAGSKEDTETVRAFFQDMRGRGRGDPVAARTTNLLASGCSSRSDAD